MDCFYNKHYISLTADSLILDGFSDAFRQPKEGDICINRQGGHQFRLFPDGEENPALWDEWTIPLYRWTGAEVVRRADEELEADRKAARKAAEAAERERRANAPEVRIAALENAMCEQDEANEAWKAEIENALCEIDGGE